MTIERNDIDLPRSIRRHLDRTLGFVRGATSFDYRDVWSQLYTKASPNEQRFILGCMNIVHRRCLDITFCHTLISLEFHHSNRPFGSHGHNTIWTQTNEFRQLLVSASLDLVVSALLNFLFSRVANVPVSSLRRVARLYQPIMTYDGRETSPDLASRLWLLYPYKFHQIHEVH